MKELKYPFDEKQVRALKAGDAVSISGRVYTGRDKFHKHFADGGKLPVDFRDGALYHCGPVVIGSASGYSVVAAGPTTSVRENPYEPAFIAKSGVRIIIGKGGMDAATLAAMKRHGCVYVQAVGGAAAVSAAAVKNVTGVSLLEEFGAAEAVWHFDVEGLRGVVAMDAHGTSLFDRVRTASAKRLSGLVRCLLVLPVLAAMGCLTIRGAREAQRDVADKGRGESAAVEAVDLRGRSLESLVGFALTNRPSIAAAALQVEDARLVVKAVDADAPLLSTTPWTAPKLAVSGGHAESSAAARHGQLKSATHGNASASLSLDLLVWDFGRHSAARDAAVEDVLAAELGLIEAGYAVFEEVATARFALDEKSALLEVALTNELEYALHLDQVNDRFAAGDAKQLDILRAKLDLSEARERTVAASNDLVTAGADLMRALGIEASRGDFAAVVGRPEHAIEEMRGGFATTDYGAKEAFALAMTNAPAMAIARTRLRAASDRVDLAVAELWPTVTASVSLDWADPLSYWRWGVSGAEALFEGFRRTTAVDRSVVAMKSAAAQVDESAQRLSLELALAVAARDNAVQALATARHSVVQARENLDMVAQQYELGDVSRVDYTDAVADYVTALGNRISAFYQGQVAEAKLFALVGRLPEYREGVVHEN